MSRSNLTSLLLVCLSFWLATATVDQTHINNLSSKNICATTSYWAQLPSVNPGMSGSLVSVGSSQFVNREITAGNSDVDEYNKLIGWGDQVHVEVWIVQDGQTCETATALHETAIIQSDDSVTCNDNVDGQGVDVYNAGTDNVLQPLGITLYVGPQDDNYGIFDLLDSNDTTSPLEPVTDPNTIAEYPNLGDEASCTSNCLFKRSKDDVSVTSGTKEYNDFTDTVALWGLSGVDATSTSTANILRNDLTQTRQEFRIDRQAANIIVNQHGRDYNYNLYAVQVGSRTLASIRIPTGYNVGETRIRRAFIQSQDTGATVTIAVPANAPVPPSSGGTADRVRGMAWYLLAPLDKIPM